MLRIAHGTTVSSNTFSKPGGLENGGLDLGTALTNLATIHQDLASNPPRTVLISQELPRICQAPTEIWQEPCGSTTTPTHLPGVQPAHFAKQGKPA